MHKKCGDKTRDHPMECDVAFGRDKKVARLLIEDRTKVGSPSMSPSTNYIGSNSRRGRFWNRSTDTNFYDSMFGRCRKIGIKIDVEITEDGPPCLPMVDRNQ